jgi:inner membrane protein
MVGLAGTAAFAHKGMPRRVWVLAPLVSAMPDIDVILFHCGVPYGDFLGHRGFFHSLFFSIVSAVILGRCFLWKKKDWRHYIWLLIVTGVSHGLLDGMTNGGMGVAFFSPFSTTRYFLPWRPIHVSPIGFHFSEDARILRLLASEFHYIWLPVLGIVFLSRLGRRLRNPAHETFGN